jgi:glycerol-3-phosphate dehydrogenase
MSVTARGAPPEVDRSQSYDVGIIGAGVVGLMVCYRLSSLGLKLAVFERNPGPGQGVTSGQASVIHVVQLPFGSMKSKLARLGNRQYDRICSDLGVPLVRVPALLIVRGPWRVPALLVVYPYLKWSLRRDFKVELARGGTLRRLEPELSESAVAGIVVHGYGAIDWQKLVERLTEELERRGVDFFFGTTVNGATATGEFVDVQTTAGHHLCRYAVNAAGLDSDEMAKKLGSDLGSHIPGLGVMAEFSGLTVRTIISPLPIRPAKHTKGGAIIPTTKGTVVFGPTLRELETKEAPSIGEEDLRILTDKFGPMLKDQGELVRLFHGVRPISPTGDFIVEYSKTARTVNLVGIESPGLTASPAIADLVLRKLEDAGLGTGGGR